jgi:predicted branched-subunit amino acid permease
MTPGSDDPRLADVAALGAAALAIGITVSAIMTDIGTSPAVIFIASFAAYSGTGELAYASVVASGGGLVPAVASALLVSSRFGLLAMSMAGRWPAPWWERAFMAHVGGEPAVAAALTAGDPAAARRAYWRIALWMAGGWVVGSALGLVVGDVIGDTKRVGLDAVFPASLMSVIVASLRRRDTATAVALGAAIALVLTPVSPAGVPILAASMGAVVALRLTPGPLWGTGP